MIQNYYLVCQRYKGEITPIKVLMQEHQALKYAKKLYKIFDNPEVEIVIYSQPITSTGLLEPAKSQFKGWNFKHENSLIDNLD